MNSRYMNNSKGPDYKKIYQDLIRLRHSDKANACREILNKKELLTIDVIKLNKIIFGHQQYNQKHKSYDKETIIKILKFQKKKSFNNIQLANYFKLSRNTITAWKKKFKI